MVLVLLATTYSCNKAKEIIGGKEEETTKTVVTEEFTTYDESTTKTVYTYDNDGKMLSKITTYSSGGEWKQTFEYDAKGRLKSDKYQYGSEKPVINSYTYNEKGDTLSIITESAMDGSYYVSYKKAYEYGQDGKKQHVYEYNAYPIEGEVTGKYNYMFTDYSYDKDGRLVKVMGYDPDYEVEYNYDAQHIDKNTSGSLRDEFTSMVSRPAIGLPTEIVLTYNSKGKLKSEVTYSFVSGIRKETNRETYDYDNKDNLININIQYAETTGTSIQFTYDDENRIVKKVSKYSSDSKETHKLKYNENGDTLIYVIENEYNNEKTTNMKEIHTYRKDGSLACVYTYLTAYDMEHGFDGGQKKLYDKHGNLTTSIDYWSENYNTPFISTVLPADVNTDFEEYLNSNGFVQKSKTTYRHAIIEKGKGIVKDSEEKEDE